MSDNVSRILRTLVQIVVGLLLAGAFQPLFDQITHDSPDSVRPYLIILFQLLTAIAMNVTGPGKAIFAAGDADTRDIRTDL